MQVKCRAIALRIKKRQSFHISGFISIILFSDVLTRSCCGSRFFASPSAPAAPFSRRAAGAAFYGRQGISGSRASAPGGATLATAARDVYPPSRILDFRVSNFVEGSLFVQLEWTAPGGDYDQGKGKKK